MVLGDPDRKGQSQDSSHINSLSQRKHLEIPPDSEEAAS